MTPIAITDDEVVALSALLATPFHRYLVTVDVDDETDLTRAHLRGQRSLRLRGWLNEENAPTDDIELVRRAMAGETVLVATWVDDEGRQVPFTERFDLVLTDDGAISWTTTGDGVHGLDVITVPQALDFFSALAQSQGDLPADDEQPRLALLVGTSETGPTGGFVVGDGVSVLSRDEAGQLKLGSSIDKTDMPGWAARFAGIDARLTTGTSAED